jgi:uncharacterized membrane protein YkvI
MITLLIVSALFFAAAIVCFVFAFLASLNDRSRKDHILGLLICAVVYTAICIFCFTRYIQQVQNKAIQHYINGDYELVDIVVNDEVVDSYYQLIEHD